MRKILLYVLLLIPSAYFVWNNRDIPRFGIAQDDSVLYVTASSLATTGEYRIASVPGAPYQTKYPPLYPMYLALAWKVNPHFPANLTVTALLDWCLIALCLALAWVLYRRSGFGEPRSYLLAASLAISPYLILFGSNILTEVFFLCWTLGALLAADRKTVRMAVLAGVLAGCAYLSRTAGIVLLVSVPLWYWTERSWRCAAAFAAAMIPFVFGWAVWASLHRMATDDPGLLYYTDYVRTEFLNVGPNNFLTVVVANVKELLRGLGSLALPRISDSIVLRVAAPITAVVMIAGVIRMARAGVMRCYAFLAAGTFGMLAIWHFPPNERLILPLFPLLLAGLLTEIEHASGMIRASIRGDDRSLRIAGYGAATALGLAVGAAVFLQLYGTLVFLPNLVAGERIRQQERRTAYSWMAEHLPASAQVLSTEDPALYLYAGLQGSAIALMPRDWYSGNTDAVLDAYRNVAVYCHARNYGYVYFADDDLLMHWTGYGDIARIDQTLSENQDLVPVYHEGIGTLYRVRPIGQ